MKDVYECTDRLIASIKKTVVYQEYEYCEYQLSMEPALKKKVDEYRAMAYEFNLSNQDDLYDKSDEFQRRFENLRKNPKVNAYLEAELALCRLMQQVTARIDGAIGLSIPEV